MSETTESALAESRFTVTVRAETRELANRVLTERLGHDEDYGFSYTVEFGDPMSVAAIGVFGWPEVTIEHDAWEETGDTDPSGRLSTSLVLNGVPLHVEARAVQIDNSGCQSASGDWPDDVDVHLASIASPDGPFLTWVTGGREYVIVAFPFC
jgi:hypothetical protein